MIEHREITLDLESEETKVQVPWCVVLFNDDLHTFDDVIIQLMRATGCAQNLAETHAWTVHSRGRAKVFEGLFDDCFQVIHVLGEIGLLTEIQG